MNAMPHEDGGIGGRGGAGDDSGHADRPVMIRFIRFIICVT
jgi:hypothetical protein